MGSVNVVSSLTHGDVVLTEIPVPHMHRHSNDDGVLAYDVEMPENSLIVAISTKDDVQVVNEDSRLFPGDTAVIVADRDQVGAVREIFREL